MARMTDLPPATQTGMRNLDCPSFEPKPFVVRTAAGRSAASRS